MSRRLFGFLFLLLTLLATGVASAPRALAAMGPRTSVVLAEMNEEVLHTAPRARSTERRALRRGALPLPPSLGVRARAVRDHVVEDQLLGLVRLVRAAAWPPPDGVPARLRRPAPPRPRGGVAASLPAARGPQGVRPPPPLG